MKKKYENDIIIKKCNKIMDIINIIKKEEDDINEGSMNNIRYDKIFELIVDIVEERIKYLNYWEENNV